MQWFANLKTALKLTFGFGLGIALLLVVGGMAFSGMSRMDKATENLITDPIPGLLYTANLLDDCKQFRLFEFRHILATDDAGMREVEDLMQKKQAEVQHDLDNYGKSISMPDDQANFDKLKAAWSQYLALNPGLLQISHRNDFKAASAYIQGNSYKTFVAVTDILGSMLTYNQNTADRLSKESKAASESSRRTISGIVLFAAVTLQSDCLVCHQPDCASSEGHGDRSTRTGPGRHFPRDYSRS